MMARWRGSQMLISLPARAPTVLIHLLPRSPPLLTSPSTCLYAHSPALSLLHSTSHAAAGEASEASWRRFSSAAKQSCRSGLPACHEGGCRAAYRRRRLADSQTAMDEHRCSGAAIEIRGGLAATKRTKWKGWSLFSASSTGENAKCECLPAENAV
jgi:hypothetical protein